MLLVRRLSRAVSAASVAAAVAGGCAALPADAVSRATTSVAETSAHEARQEAEVLVISACSPDKGTAKIAGAIAGRLQARVLSPHQVEPADLGGYALVGFGSGIFDQRHHAALLDLADRLPQGAGLRVFLFSTSGVSRRFALDHGIEDPHAALREKLAAKGCLVVGEFNCAGFNDNSFLKLFGGMNRGRPNQDDLALAEAFADGLSADGVSAAGGTP